MTYKVAFISASFPPRKFVWYFDDIDAAMLKARECGARGTPNGLSCAVVRDMSRNGFPLWGVPFTEEEIAEDPVRAACHQPLPNMPKI